MSDFTDFSEEDLDNIISCLHFISTIPPNHKPCFNNQTIIEKTAWFATFRRRWNSEKGEDGVEFVKKILDSCDKCYRMCYNSALETALKNSRDGFLNLILTYSDQTEVSKGYTQCLNKLDSILNTYSGKQLVKIVPKKDQKKFFNSNLVLLKSDKLN